MSGVVVVNAADGPIAAVAGGAPTFVPPTPTPVPSAGVVVRGADEGPIVPESPGTLEVDAGRIAAYGGIAVIAVYLLARGAALLRRR
jgi:hypothetical protein